MFASGFCVMLLCVIGEAPFAFHFSLFTSCPLLERGAFSKPLSARNRTLGVFRDLRIATRALPSTCELLKKFDQNLNTGARRLRLLGLSACFYFVCGRSMLGAVTLQKPRSAACTRKAGTVRGTGSRRDMPARAPRPEGNGSGHCPPPRPRLFKNICFFRRYVL